MFCIRKHTFICIEMKMKGGVRESKNNSTIWVHNSGNYYRELGDKWNHMWTFAKIDKYEYS